MTITKYYVHNSIQTFRTKRAPFFIFGLWMMLTIMVYCVVECFVACRGLTFGSLELALPTFSQISVDSA